MQIQKIVQTLLKLNALRKSSQQHKVCAAVVKNKHVVDLGFNSKKTHPKQKSLNELKPYLHAEVEAILRASKSLKDFDKCCLVVVRTKKDGPFGDDIPGTSKPCEGCEKFIRFSGIRKVYYLDEKGKICLLNLK